MADVCASAAEAPPEHLTTLRRLHGRYLLALGCTALVVLGTIFWLDWFVDPLALRSRDRAMFPADYGYEREVRYNLLTSRRPEVVILGTSQTGHGIDPGNAVFAGRRSYNAAISGGSIGELTVLMRHVGELGSVRAVYLGIDYLMTRRGDDAGFNPVFLASTGLRGWMRGIEARLSGAMLLASLKEVLQKLQGHESYADERGHLRAANFEAILQAQGGPYGAMGHSIRSTTRALLRPRVDFERRLRDIIAIACRNHIDLTLFTPPSHAYMLALLHDLGLQQAADAWERMVVHDVEAAPCRTAFWDFTVVNPTTTEAVPPPGRRTPMTNYWDAVHYRQNVGDEMLAAMFDETVQGPPLPGQRLTHENIDAFQRRRAAGLAGYAAEHAPDMARIAKQAAAEAADDRQ